MVITAVLLVVLDRFPLLYHPVGVADITRTEDMGMPADQFGRDVAENSFDIEPPLFPGDFRVHYGEQDQVAQFLAKILVVTGADRSGDFVSLLDEPRQQ